MERGRPPAQVTASTSTTESPVTTVQEPSDAAPHPALAVALLELSTERDGWLRRVLAAEIRGYDRGVAHTYPAAWADGYAAAEADMAEIWSLTTTFVLSVADRPGPEARDSVDRRLRAAVYAEREAAIAHWREFFARAAATPAAKRCRVTGFYGRDYDDDDNPIPESADLDGAQLLAELHSALTRYVILPSPEAADAVVLWIAATHGVQAWHCAPRLDITSPVKRCGKSRLLDIIEATCYNPLITVNISPAALVRSITEDLPTLLLDEADAVFGPKAADNHEDLRGILNAGHSRNRPYIRWDIRTRDTEKCPRSRWLRWPASARCPTRSPTGR